MIYTIGHSNHTPEAFVGLLRRHGVVALVDVRSRPYSKWVPHFQRAPLSRFVGAAEIEYFFLGRELGGRPEGPAYYGPDGKLDHARRARAADFLAGIEQLLQVARDRTTAILCAEEDPARCHRRLLVAPAIRAKGVEVVHIRGDGRLEPDAEPASPQLPLFE